MICSNNNKRVLLVGAFILSFSLFVFAQTPVDISFGTHLFLDDHLLQNYKGIKYFLFYFYPFYLHYAFIVFYFIIFIWKYLSGLYFEQHQPIKKEIVITSEYEWENVVSFKKNIKHHNLLFDTIKDSFLYLHSPSEWKWIQNLLWMLWNVGCWIHKKCFFMYG